MKACSINYRTRSSAMALALATVIVLGAGAMSLAAAQKPQHTGTKLDGFSTVVTPDTITVFDRRNQEIEIHTDKDYSSLVGIAVPVTVWYTTKDGVNHLEDIEFPPSGSFIPRNQFQERIKRIVIFPVAEDVDDTGGLISAIAQYLTDNVGWRVYPPERAEQVIARLGASGSQLNAINPDTGEVNMQEYLEPQNDEITKLAQSTRSDAVLEVRLVKVKATVRNSIASWDDMKEPVASKKSQVFSPMAAFHTKGWVYAATADMSLWSRSGGLLWRKRRGFAVLGKQSGLASKYHPRPLDEVYVKDDVMQRWLADTMGSLATTITEAPEESPRLSPQLQKQLEKARQAGEEIK